MELKDFVAQTLKSILDGVAQAQDETEGTSSHVAPLLPEELPEGFTNVVSWAGQLVTEVEFSVALTNEGSKSNEGGIGVAFPMVNVKLGTERKSSDTETSMTNIKFSVPIVYPISATDAKNIHHRMKPQS